MNIKKLNETLSKFLEEVKTVSDIEVAHHKIKVDTDETKDGLYIKVYSNNKAVLETKSVDGSIKNAKILDQDELTAAFIDLVFEIDK